MHSKHNKLIDDTNSNHETYAELQEKLGIFISLRNYSERH